MHVIPHPFHSMQLRNGSKGWVLRLCMFVMHITHTHTYTVSSVGTGRAGTDFREHYLGPLYPSEQYKMYGKNICIFIYLYLLIDLLFYLLAIHPSIHPLIYLSLDTSILLFVNHISSIYLSITSSIHTSIYQ